MRGVSVYDFQGEAVEKMKRGCILCGIGGSGKSRTSLAYYYVKHGGILNTETYAPMTRPIPDLYIITTARKRDTLEWEKELLPFAMSTDPKSNLYSNKIVVDSWNNLHKYVGIENAFFIFDEQRVVGRGEWVKSFLKIAKVNHWILLSATPGDNWNDYLPVFIANGFFKNRSEFNRDHVIFAHSPNIQFPKIQAYTATGRLMRMRESILVDMDFIRNTHAHHEDVFVSYDIRKYKELGRMRWNPYKNQPVENAAELCYLWRRVVNEDISRQVELLEILDMHPKAIVFYNFDYELEILRSLRYSDGTVVAEWNGHTHDELPTGDKWVYLVQYSAGCEGWNCTTTDTMIFYSMNYSYKVMSQAAWRTDRLNTPFKELFYYHLKSRSPIDLAIGRALDDKKSFNESRYLAQINIK